MYITGKLVRKVTHTRLEQKFSPAFFNVQRTRKLAAAFHVAQVKQKQFRHLDEYQNLA